ncbi:MAG TPA: cytidylate kinase-like family protein [Desulfobacteraceae bacterium]|nr:cytidylate kinase-like family protein [Desulfobacteraceae bacterium]
MAIVTISRGSYSKGKEVAEKVAERLGYRCISRDVLIEASQDFNVPEIKLIRAVQDAPSIFKALEYGKEKYIAYIKAALLKQLLADNVVYHGLAGHFFVSGISHVLKVRIVADLEDRIRLEMAREGIIYEKAMALLQKDDEERRKWGRDLYGIDTWDPSLYDLVIHIKQLSTDDATKIIVDTVQMDKFTTTPDSSRALHDLTLAAEVKAALMDVQYDIHVQARDGSVEIHLKAPPVRQLELKRRIYKIVETIPEVKEINLKMSRLTMYGE